MKRNQLIVTLKIKAITVGNYFPHRHGLSLKKRVRFRILQIKIIRIYPLYCFQEDMNLSEEKKTPLRDKDLSTKREMVIQYMFTASKTVSFLHEYVLTFLSPSLRE